MLLEDFAWAVHRKTGDGPTCYAAPGKRGEMLSQSGCRKQGAGICTAAARAESVSQQGRV